MAKVIVHATMSLDGFIAGPHDEMDWVFKFDDYGSMADDVMQSMGAVVLGKRTFEVSVRDNHMPYGGAFKVPQFVVTPEAQEPLHKGGLDFTFVTSLEQAITKAKAAAADKNVCLLGASIDQQCIKTGLADEIVVHVAPLLLCKGTRLFDQLGDHQIALEKVAVEERLQLTNMRFRLKVKV